MKYSVKICLLVIAALAVYSAAGEGPPPPSCRPGLIIDCIQGHVDLVWAKDEAGVCKVYVNRCVFNNVNCGRYRRKQTLLAETPKEQCQKSCVNDCSQAPTQSVCAESGGNHCTFDSECEYNKNICNSGQYRFRVADSNCQNVKACDATTPY